jgi:hypothetical protein
MMIRNFYGRDKMNSRERDEFKKRVRAYMESGLNDELFGDLALMYAVLEDPTIDGASLSRLKPYESQEGWARLRTETAVSR